MKKLMVALVTLLVMLLPSLVEGQEPTNNGTVPYTVWVPVVRGGGTCEYDVMRIRYDPGYSGGNHPFPPIYSAWIGLDGSELPRLEEPVADVLYVEVQSGLNPEELLNRPLQVLEWMSENGTLGLCPNTYCHMYPSGYHIYARGRVVCDGGINSGIYGAWSPVFAISD